MKKILLLRQNNSEDAIFFEKRGYEPVCISLSQTILRELSQQDCQLINHSDWLIFTSQTAVEQVLAVLKNPKVKIAAVGLRTAEKIETAGFHVDFIPRHQTKKGLLAEGSFQGSILYPKGNLADDLLEEELGAKGIVCYDNKPVKENLAQLEEVLSQGILSAAYFASPSAWSRFNELYRHHPQKLELIAIGETSKAAIEADIHQSVLLKKEL